MKSNVGNTLGRSIWRSIAGRPHLTHAHIASPTSCSASLGSSALSRSYAPGSKSSPSTLIRAAPSIPSLRPQNLAFVGLRTAFPLAFRAGATVAVRPRLAALAQLLWRRNVHCKTCGAMKMPNTGDRRNKSSISQQPDRSAPHTQPTQHVPQAELSPNPKRPEDVPGHTGKAESDDGKPLLDRLPHLHMPRRPTKEELLAAANGFWARMRVRLKWHTVKSLRPYNMDDISAFISWILVGHVVWIIVGTTTFFSLAVFLINTVFAQETLARWIGNYLTQSSGVKVVFESAVVPKWKDGVISVNKVFVSRRPGQGRASVSKGSQTTAAAAAAAAAQQEHGLKNAAVEEEDTNYTQFDVSIDTVNVTLSFTKWWNGKGLLKDVEIKGVRGVIDRTSVKSPDEYVDPRTYKHEHHPGDFELDSFKMEDLLVTVYQPNDFRPFPVSIYSCDLPQLRKQFLFYDFMSANMISGSFDNSLFTIHPRQVHNLTGAQLNAGQEVEGPTEWKKHSRVRIDGLNIDHLNRGVEGPFGWIHEGDVDIVADIMFPADNDGSIAKVMSDFYDRVEATVTNSSKIPEDGNTVKEQTDSEAKEVEKPRADDDDKFVIMDVRVHLNNVKAAVPLFTNDMSYVNQTLIRPIVAYINSRKTFIPVTCRVVKRLSEFDGSWTIYDSGLMEDLSRELYEAFARDVTENNTARKRRFKKVGIWTLQLAAQALFIGLAGNIA